MTTEPLPIPEGHRFEYREVTTSAGLGLLWALVTDKGAIHIWARPDTYEHRRRDWMGGIEVHYASAPDYMIADKPSHDRCWLLDKPCWHDGSSLYFSEYIADFLPRQGGKLDDYVHRSMLGILTSWHRDKIEGAAA